mmetsp:Transcript_15420/g.40752  ORF Transcript_15420/g.40752 Transcript_15420/m.40752 type:complete len:251 (+) Transcript_15420:1049-1801(+)
MPKSLILTFDLQSSRMLLGLMSRWICLRACMASRPQRTESAIIANIVSGITHPGFASFIEMRPCSEPAFMYSRTTQMAAFSGSVYASRDETTYGHAVSTASMLASNWPPSPPSSPTLSMASPLAGPWAVPFTATAPPTPNRRSSCTASNRLPRPPSPPPLLPTRAPLGRSALPIVCSERSSCTSWRRRPSSCTWTDLMATSMSSGTCRALWTEPHAPLPSSSKTTSPGCILPHARRSRSVVCRLLEAAAH